MVTEIDMCNLADDNTLHTCDIQLDVLMKRVETAASSAMVPKQWNENES